MAGVGLGANECRSLESDEAARSFRFAPTLFARLFVVTVGPGLPQRAFAVEFLLQAPQRLLYRLTFLQFDFRQ